MPRGIGVTLPITQPAGAATTSRSALQSTSTAPAGAMLGPVPPRGVVSASTGHIEAKSVGGGAASSSPDGPGSFAPLASPA